MARRPEKRRIGRLAGLGAMSTIVLALFSGCAALPSSGPVGVGNPGDIAGNAIQLDILASGPSPRASRDQILRGFLDAAASPQFDYRVARLFLTPDLASRWKPDQGTVVDRAAERVFTTESSGNIRLTVNRRANISSSGVYQPASGTETVGVSFLQVGGQWRISDIPNGVIVDDATFALVYRSVKLYFFSADGRSLVPDVRWIPRRESSLTAVVRALVAGPREWLAPAVQSAFPVGTQLDTESVPVDAGSARLSLSMPALPGAMDLARLRLQVLTTLADAFSVRSVVLTVNGSLENLIATATNVSVGRTVDSRSLVRLGAEFGFLSPVTGTFEKSSELTRAAQAVSTRAVSYRPASGEAVILGTAGVYRSGGAGSHLDLVGSGYVAASLDRTGTLWAATTDGSLVWSRPDGQTGRFSLGLAGLRPTDLSASPDGARLVIGVTDGRLVHALGIAVARAANLAPASIGPSLILASSPGTTGNLDWVSDSEVALLSHGLGQPKLTVVMIGGQVTEQQAPETAVAITGGNGVRDIRLLDSQGNLWLPAGASWQIAARSVSLLGRSTGE